MKNWIILAMFTIFISNIAIAQCIEDSDLIYGLKIEDENFFKSKLEIEINKNKILNLYGSNVEVKTNIVSCQGSYVYFSSKNENIDKINIELIQEPNNICEFMIISRIFVNNKKIDTYKKYFFIEKINTSNIEENYYLDTFKDKNEVVMKYNNVNQNEEEH